MMAPDATTGGGLLGSVRQATVAVREAARRARLPQLPVAVRAPRPRDGGDRSALQARAAGALAEVVRAHLEEMGVPGRPAVQVTLLEEADPDAIRITVNQRPCRLPEPRLRDALEVVGGGEGRLRELDERTWLAAVETACHVVLEYDPSALVGAAQRDAMLARARASGIDGYEDEMLAGALEQVVANGVSVRHVSSLAGGLPADEPVETAAELAEVLIDRLRPPSFALSIPQRTLRLATQGAVDVAAFIDMRVRLFLELGVFFPDLDLVVAADQPEGTCALRLNHVTMRPVRLPDGATVHDLVRLTEARLREHASWFVDLNEVRRVVRDLRLALPELVNTVRGHYSWPHLAVLARTLIEESVPARNAARLMVLLLDATAPGAERDVVRLAEPHRRGPDGTSNPPSPRQFVAWTRQQIQEELARARPGLADVAVMPLPADLERDLERPARAGATSADDAVIRLLVLAEQCAKARQSIVVPTQRHRETVRNLLSRQYPDVPVLASEEFPPSWRLTAEAAG